MRKVIIAGGRDFGTKDPKNPRAKFYHQDRKFMADCLLPTRYMYGNGELEIVSGVARGADELGEDWASRLMIHVKRFPADWEKHGRSAGPIRNKAMAEYADELVAFWDGTSKGTGNMIRTMLAMRKPVHVFFYE